MRDFAPPAAPLLVTPPQPSTRSVFVRIPPGWVGARHRTPQKQIIICLRGSVRFTGSDGATFVLEPGERILDANAKGEGHVTEVVSDGPLEAILVALE